MATKLTETLEALKPREPTERELYEKAQFLGVKGRSKMNEGALKAAVNRRRSKMIAPRGSGVSATSGLFRETVA